MVELRTQNVTIQGRKINANALITSLLRFMLHGLHIQPTNKKMTAIQETLTIILNPVQMKSEEIDRSHR